MFRAEIWAVALVVSLAVVARFVTRSPLWLDEALSVNIATLPIPDLLDALRSDGHPPLYYVLLHAWMELFGSGDVAVRALSGLASVLTLPLAWAAGRRRRGTAGGLAVLLLTAMAPYSLRYATEARMYALVMALVFAGWLLADDLRTRGDRGRWAALAAVTGAALLTHYWTIYLCAAAVLVLAWRWWRRGARHEAVRIGSALTAGAVLFLPWLPSFLHQAANTGTPWGTASRPTRALVDLAVGLGGRGSNPEAITFGFAILLLAALALVASSTEGTTIEIDLRTTPAVRPEVVVAGLTWTIGLLVGAVTASTFMPRYAAVFLPMVLIAAGVGLTRLPTGPARWSVTAALVVLATVGAVINVTGDRSQGEEFAQHIAAAGTNGDVVAFCPDQLGPSTLRYLPEGFEAVGVPTLERPTRIDWVDYEARNRGADPEAVAAAILDRAGGAAVWMVHNSTYRTYETLCDAVLAQLAAARPDNGVVAATRPDVEENAILYRFGPG